MRPTVQEVRESLIKVSNVSHHCPVTANKGAVGHLLEDLLGIPRSSDCLDLSDGELKIVPLKQLKNGKIVPKETIAVTMMEKEFVDFTDSRCFKKMRRMLVVPYLRNGDTITFYPSSFIEMKGDLLKLIEADYMEIRSNPLQSKIGKYLQTRTKGPGGVKKTRAFYLRTSFINQFVNF